MSTTRNDKSDAIRQLNDAFRRSFAGGKVMLTAGVNALPDDVKAQVLQAVRTFDAFDDGNDPYREHDFLSVNVDGHEIFAKVDYYDRDLRSGSEDPSDPEQTTRVMTIMLASEY